MKFVAKTTPCVPFDAWIAAQNPADWSKVKADKKLILHQHLLREQQHLCIYCQQSIPFKRQKDRLPTDIHPSHIEHIRPKMAWPNLVFDQKNLAVSCEGFDVDLTTRTRPDFCGHEKGDDLDEALFLHPFEESEIEQFFEYDSIGAIKPTAKSQAKAAYTIELLQLNNSTLKVLREENYLALLNLQTNGDRKSVV